MGKTLDPNRGARRAGFLAAALIALASPGEAAGVDAIDTIAAQLEACQKAPDHANTMATNGCFADALEAADKVLAKTYEAALARPHATPGDDARAQKDRREIAGRLASAQKAWTAYRTAECAFQATEMLGGSGEAAAGMDCEFKLTRARIKGLARWIADWK